MSESPYITVSFPLDKYGIPRDLTDEEREAANKPFRDMGRKLAEQREQLVLNVLLGKD